MEIKLVATTGRAQGQAIEIKAAKFFIGRHDNCQIRPDIPDLAGIHALIEQRDLRVYLRDFGAEGGTGINDRVLHARETEVFDGDLIQIGPMVLTMSIKAKPDDPYHHALTTAPVGWPFLDDASEELFRAASKKLDTPNPVTRHTSTPHPPVAEARTFRQAPASPSPRARDCGIERRIRARQCSDSGPGPGRYPGQAGDSLDFSRVAKSG